MSQIYVAYRRNDIPKESEDIFKRLCTEFGFGRVVQDIHSIDLGDDWRQWIESQLARTTLLIVVIGPNWLRLLKDRQRDDDMLRFEISTALRQGVPVIPLTMRGATLPETVDLPDDLRKLPDCHGLTIHDPPYFDTDVQILIDRLKRDFPELLETPDDRTDIRWSWTQREGRRRGRLALLAVLALLAILYIWTDHWPPRSINPSTLTILLHNHLWVGYDTRVAPDQHGVARELSTEDITQHIDTIDQELQAIKDAGFTGIVTFGSNRLQANIPRLAKARDPRLAVIMGIWDVTSPDELGLALRQKQWVDAYCVGFNRLGADYSLADLEGAVWLLKKRTGLPVAISEQLIRYDERLALVGDWLFPDAHLLPRQGSLEVPSVHLSRDVERFKESAKAMAALAIKVDRPLVFNAVAYPHTGLAGASEETQAAFYAQLLDSLRDSQFGLSVPFSIVAHSAFDDPSKTDPPFHSWDPHNGLLLDGGGRRPAVVDILKRHPAGSRSLKARGTED